MPARIFPRNGRQWTRTTLFGFSNRCLSYLSYPARICLVNEESQERESNPHELVYESDREARFRPA